MSNFICLLATVLAVLTIPFLLIYWATESKTFKARRLRRQGQSWASIATTLGVSATTARRWAAA